MNKFKIIFALSGLIPVLLLFNSPPDLILLIYTLFVFVFFFRNHLQSFVNKLPLNASIKFFIFALIFGLISESFVWVSLQMSGDTQEISKNLTSHLLNFSGFYIGIALSWAILLRVYKFSLLQLFITQGIFGVIIEQHGAVLLQAVTNPLAVIYIPYVVLTYSSYVAIAYLLIENQLIAQSKLDHWIKYVLGPIFTFLIIMFISFIFPLLGLK